jgi:hypothetical protein
MLNCPIIVGLFRMSLTAQEAYDHIMLAWMNNESSKDIYFRILDWLRRFKDSVHAKDELEDIMMRISQKEHYRHIVEDFIYGGDNYDAYPKIRRQFNTYISHR